MRIRRDCPHGTIIQSQKRTQSGNFPSAAFLPEATPGQFAFLTLGDPVPGEALSLIDEYQEALCTPVTLPKAPP